MTNKKIPMDGVNKQLTPLAGEINPKDAFIKSRQIAAKYARQYEKKTRKLKDK